MFNLQLWEDLILKDGEGECSFFDFCERNKITVEVVRKDGSRLQKIEGYLREYQPENFMFSIKGREGHDYDIPFKDVVLITIKGTRSSDYSKMVLLD